MSELLSDLLPSLTQILGKLLYSSEYLLKGGQAVRYHAGTFHSSKNARFSQDLDFSFSVPSFPYDLSDFKQCFVEEYNGHAATPGIIKEEEIYIQKLPRQEHCYFGIRMDFIVHEKRSDGSPKGSRIYFRDIEGFKVIIDFSLSEYVEEHVCVTSEDGIRYAHPDLIIAEKYRALCSHKFDPEANTTSRAKDLYDIFFILREVYTSNPPEETQKRIVSLIEKVFQIKEMSTRLLKTLDEEETKEFHSNTFESQVIATLTANNPYRRISYDQVYSEALEFLDNIGYLD